MIPVAYSLMCPSPYLFYIYLVSLKDGKRLGLLGSGDNILKKILSSVNNYKLIGIENQYYDDVILNYIYHNREINIHEIYELSMALIDTKLKGFDIWTISDFKQYVGTYVTSFDLTNSKYDVKLLDRKLSGDSVGELMLTCNENTDIIVNEYFNIKKKINNGFKKINNDISDNVHNNFLIQELCLK